jgi:hypothetical protein
MDIPPSHPENAVVHHKPSSDKGVPGRWKPQNDVGNPTSAVHPRPVLTGKPQSLESKKVSKSHHDQVFHVVNPMPFFPSS